MGKVVAKEVRADIVGKVQAGERVPALVAQDGISAKSIYGWLRQNSGEAVVAVLEYNKLKRLVGELTLNMHVQKKVK
jgi:hypothetical protein